MVDVRLIQGDCLEVLRGIPDDSIHAIITDLPYGTTACAWDEVIPFAPMWEQVKRVLKPRGAFVTTASQPFTSKLVMSNLEWFRYEWIWDKRNAANFGDVKHAPLRTHEGVLIFSGSTHTYNPQLVKIDKPFGRLTKSASEVSGGFGGKHNGNSGVGYPKTIQSFMRPNNLTGGGLHPTQKPVALYAYLIRTYTNPGDTVLDFCMGSGTTGVACIKTGRNFIGVELDKGYFAIAEKRIEQAQMQMPLLEAAG